MLVLHEQLGIDVLYVQGKYSVGQQGDIVNLIEHMVLPVAVLMLTSVAAWSRYQRDSMLEVLHTDYVRTARAKGVPRRQVIRRHALRNALIPFVTVVAIDAGVLLGGVVVVERVFSWPGLGLLFFDALERSDYPVILAWMAVATVFVVLFNLLADILYAALDPRIRVGGPYRRRKAHRRSASPHEHACRRRVGPGAGRGDRSRAARARSGAARRSDGSEWRGAWRRFRRHPLAMIGLGFLVFMFLACFVGANFAPDPNHQNLLEADLGSVVGATGSAPTS